MITMTDAAVAKVKTFLAEPGNESKALRLAVVGGGCSGFQYDLTLDDPQDGDTTLEVGGVQLVLDQHSAEMLKGTSIDYVESLQGEGFSIKNPNATSSCGCGSSFGV